MIFLNTVKFRNNFNVTLNLGKPLQFYNKNIENQSQRGMKTSLKKTLFSCFFWVVLGGFYWVNFSGWVFHANPVTNPQYFQCLISLPGVLSSEVNMEQRKQRLYLNTVKMSTSTL